MDKFIPRVKRKFRAFLKVERPGKEHYASPFMCLGHVKRVVEAVDCNDNLCRLNRHDFYFEPA